MADKTPPPKTTTSTPQSKSTTKRKSGSTHQSPQEHSSPNTKTQTKLTTLNDKTGKVGRKSPTKQQKAQTKLRTQSSRKTTGMTLQVKQEKLDEADKAACFDSDGEDIYSDKKYASPTSSPLPLSSTSTKQLSVIHETPTETKPSSSAAIISTDNTQIDIPVKDVTEHDELNITETDKDLSKDFERETTSEAASMPTTEDTNQCEESSTVTTEGNESKSCLRESKYKTTTAKIQSNLSGAPINTTRYTLNLDVTEEQKGTAGLREVYIEFIKKLKEYCPDLILLPWNTEVHKDKIKNPDKIPETITKLQQYFDGAKAKDSGGTVYAKIHLGFPVRFDRKTFEADVEDYTANTKIRFYATPVQHHHVKVACWLPYLTCFTNKPLVSQIMTDWYKKTYKKSVPIGLSWRALNGQWDVPAKQRIYAVHVECTYEHTTNVRKFLRTCSHQKNIQEAHVSVS